jgi:hypothetical protein
MKKTLLSFAALVLVPLCVQAQSEPPVKMGLWETTVVSKMTGLNLPPQVVERMKQMGRPIPGAEPTTNVVQGCLTPEKWKETWSRAQKNEDCHMQNVKQDASGMSADINCKSEHGSSTGHMQINFVSPEKAHGTVHMEIVTERQPQPLVMDVTMDSAYQGADCKGISPDEAKVIKHE